MLRFASLLEKQSFRRFPPPHFQPERLKSYRNAAPYRRNARNSLSFAPSRLGNLLFGKFSTNICLLFKSLLRAYFDFRTKTQRPSPPLHPKVRRRTSPNTPLKDLFFARKSRRFYVPKMHLKNANGCSVCAWLLTSGGLRPTLRLRRNVTRSLRSRAPTKRTHFLRQIDRLTTQFFIAQMHRKQETRLLDEKRGGERSRPR